MKNAIQKTIQVMLLVCISYVGFAQQNIINTTKSNIRDSSIPIADTTKIKVPPPKGTNRNEQNIVNTTKSNIKDSSKPIADTTAIDSTKIKLPPVKVNRQEQTIFNTTRSNVKDAIAANIICPEGYTRISGECVPNVILNAPWIDKRTLSIKYFQYDADYVIDAPEICMELGVQQIIIQKGIYKVQRPSPQYGGRVMLTLKEPIDAERIKNTDGRKFDTDGPKAINCKSVGNVCFYSAKPSNANNIQTYTLTPIIENGKCTKLELQYNVKPGVKPGPNERGSGSPKAAGF